MYNTIAQAETYFEGRLNADAWDNASDTKRTKGLTQASRILDQLNYLGRKYDVTQDAQFPRDSDTVVPDQIRYAECELALVLLDGVDPELEYENLWMISQSYGSAKSTYDRESKPTHLVAGIPSMQAWRYLRPFLRDPSTVNLKRTS